MVDLNLGGFFSVGGRTVVSGQATGFDVEQIVTDLVSARSITANQVQDKIDANTEKVAAYNDLKDILTRLQQASDFLRNPTGVNNEADNVFEYRTSSILSNTSIDGSTYLNAVIQPGATISNSEIEIQNLAEAKAEISAVGFADRTSSIVEAAGGATAGMFSEGTITLNALGTDVDIVFEEGDSLNEIVTKVNARKDDSGVEARVLQVADGDFRLILQSTETGTAYAYTMTDDGSGVFNEVGFNVNNVAEDAQLTIDGIAITRSSNSIGDLIDNVTLNLVNETPGGTTLDMRIQEDSEVVLNGVLNFIDTYNELKLFAANQSARGEDGEPLETAKLSGEATLRNVTNNIGNELSTLIDGLGQSFNDLADIGITFDDFDGDAENAETRNILVIDTDEFNSALASDFDAVRKIFEFSFTSDSSDLQVFRRSNSMTVREFSLDIDTTAKTAKATFDDNGTPKTIDLEYDDSVGSILLTGADGTELEGLQLIYSDTVSDTINVSYTQGFGDRLYNAVDKMLDEDGGVVTTQITNLGDLNDNYEFDLERLNEQIERYRQTLLDQFTALEQAISRVNSILESLTSLDAARNNG